MLTFDEAAHRYYFQGKEVQGVTSVLKVLNEYGDIPQEMLKQAAERGIAVHSATELLDEDNLDWGTLSDELIPYVSAWDKFKSESGVEILAMETMMLHPTFCYAGRLDREVILQGKRGVLDIKTSVKIMPGVGPQTAAYLEAGNHGRERADKMTHRWVVQLRSDGTYRLEPLKDKTDWSIFLACLSITNWRKNHA